MGVDDLLQLVVAHWVTSVALLQVVDISPRKRVVVGSPLGAPIYKRPYHLETADW